MVVIASAREALSHVREQPVLFLPLAVFSVLQVPQLFLETLDPIVALVVSLALTGVFVFVTPLFYAGTLGMANDAARGRRTSLARFVTHVKAHYLSVLGGYLLITAVSFAVGLVTTIAAFAALIAVGAGGGDALLTVATAGIVVVVVLLFLALLFAVHFYAHAIVVEDAGAIDGLQRSVHVVRHNLKPVVGYAVLSLAGGGAVGGLSAVLISRTIPTSSVPGEPAPMPDLLPAVLGSLGTTAVTTVFGTVFAVFSVVFYRALVDADEPTGRNGRTDAPDTSGATDSYAAD